MEVAPRYKLLKLLTLLTLFTLLILLTWHTLSTWFALLTWFTMLTWLTTLAEGDEGDEGAKGGEVDTLWEGTGCGLKHPVESDCRTRVSSDIFKLNVPRGCPGVFLN